MNARLPLFLVTLAGLVLVAGCASPTARTNAPARAPAWHDVGTPALAAQPPPPKS